MKWTDKIKGILPKRRPPTEQIEGRKYNYKKISLIVLSTIVLLIAIFAGVIYGMKKTNTVTKTAATVFPYPAAVVNWSPVTLKQYLFTKDYTYHFYDASKLTYDPSKLNNQILDSLIDQKIVQQHAAKAKITVSGDEINQAYQKLIDKSGKDEVNKVLNDMYNLNESQFKQLISDQLLKQKLETSLTDKGEWYQIQVRHILIKVDQTADQKTVDDARAKAQSNLDQIKAGKTMDELARLNSEDTQSKDQGGELGYVSRGQTVAEFEAAVFASGVKKGDVLGPIRTQYGWHVILIEDIRGSNDYTIWRNQAKIYRLFNS